MRHHALGEERVERLDRFGGQVAGLVHRTGEEARVQQVQNRVFDAADVLIDVHPIVGILGHSGRRGAGRGEAGVVPRRIDESIHRVRLAPGCRAAFRAGAVAPCRVTVQRVAGDVEGDIVGQLDGQVFLFLGHHTTGGAVDHRDRAAPIPLAGNSPVAQAVFGDALAVALRLGMGDGGGHTLFAGLNGVARKAADIGDLFRLHRHIGLGEGHISAVRRENWFDRQGIFRRKVEIALVMGGAAENGTRAVVHQNEVGDPDRQFPSGIQRVFHADAGVHADLFGGFQRLGGGAAQTALGEEGGDLGVGFQRFGQGVIGRDGGKRRAHERVGAGGVNLDLLEALWRADGVKGELQPARLTDPVGLHQPHLLGPVFQPVQGGEEFFGVVGDLKEPLGQLTPFHGGPGPPALALDHLLIGQNRHIDRVPIHHGSLAVNQTLFHHVDEHRLLLAVVFRVAGGKFAAPVDGQAQGLHLRAHVGDVAVGPFLGMAAPLHGGVFGGHAESVPAHRVQHGKSLRHLIARHHVAHGVVAHMAHVDAPRGIGEHFQDVILGLGRIAPRGEGASLIPGGLPFWFDGAGFVARHVWPQNVARRDYTAAGPKVQTD